MLPTVALAIPAQSLPRTRSGAGIHCPATCAAVPSVRPSRSWSSVQGEKRS